jgi:hypothetical protein
LSHHRLRKQDEREQRQNKDSANFHPHQIIQECGRFSNWNASNA